MIPYNLKQWAIDPKLLNYNWITEKVPMPKIEEALDGALRQPHKKFGPNAEFWYPKQGGMEVLPCGFLPYVRNMDYNFYKIFSGRLEFVERYKQDSDNFQYQNWLIIWKNYKYVP